jgi:hypothetical protein
MDEIKKRKYKRWSSYIGTYHCLKGHTEFFARIGKGVYVYDPQLELAPDLLQEGLVEIILDHVKIGEKLRANEICNRIFQHGISVQYKSIFRTLNKFSDFIKNGLPYSRIE